MLSNTPASCSGVIGLAVGPVCDLPFNDYFEYYQPDFHLEVPSTLMVRCTLPVRGIRSRSSDTRREAGGGGRVDPPPFF